MIGYVIIRLSSTHLNTGMVCGGCVLTNYPLYLPQNFKYGTFGQKIL